MKAFRLLILVAFLLVGCSSPTPTPTAVAPQPTVAAATTAPLAAPTETLIPATVTSVPTAVPTALPPAATPNALQQVQAYILPLVAPCNFADQEISFSPNKTWVVVTCQGDKPEDGTLTRVVRLDGSQEWNLSFNETYIQTYQPVNADMSALLQKSYIPVRWTIDESFVYLAVQSSTAATPYAGYDGLFRLDLSTGKTSPILKPATSPLSSSYAFAFSSGGTKLAYINQTVKTVSIVIDDATSGDEKRITLDARFTKGGNLLWSPDEKQLLVSVLDENTNGGNSLIVYDLETGKNELVSHQTESVYLPLKWIDATTVYAQSRPGSWVYIDMQTRDVRPAAAP